MSVNSAFLYVFHLFVLPFYILRVSIREIIQLIYSILYILSSIYSVFCYVQCATQHIYWVVFIFLRSLFLYHRIVLLSYECDTNLNLVEDINCTYTLYSCLLFFLRGCLGCPFIWWIRCSFFLMLVFFKSSVNLDCSYFHVIINV